jgi:hypothetical protein
MFARKPNVILGLAFVIGDEKLIAAAHPAISASFPVRKNSTSMRGVMP